MEHLERPCHPSRIHRRPPQMQHGGLRHAPDDLVRALHCEVGPRVHGRGGQRRVEVEVWSMGLVHEQDLARTARRRHDRRHVGRDSVVVRAGHGHDPRPRMGRHGSPRGGGADVHSNTQVGVETGEKEPGRGAGEDDARQDGLVGVSRHQHLVSRPDRGEDHGVIADSRPVDQEERSVGPVGLCRQFLGLFDDAHRFLEAVHLVQRGEVDGEDLAADELPEAGRDPLPALVAGGVERDLLGLGQADHRIEERGPELMRGNGGHFHAPIGMRTADGCLR